MKLTISAKELLALYNLLDSRYARVFAGEDNYKEAGGISNDDDHLRQVHNRLRACIVGALTTRAADPVDAFLSKEQAKIDKLKVDLEDVKSEQSDLAVELKFESDESDPDFIYPRRGSRQKQPGGGRKR